jgi:hypothetical protein
MKRKRYTQLENILFLDIPSEQQVWQQSVVEDLRAHKAHWETLPQRVERRRMEQGLHEMYAGEKGTS